MDGRSYSQEQKFYKIRYLGIFHIDVVHEYSTHVTNASKPKGLEYQFLRLGGQNAAEDVSWRVQEQSCRVAATVFILQGEFSAKFILGN